MNISVVNHTDGGIADEDLQTAIRAINRQIAENFVPYWGMPAVLRLEGRSAKNPNRIQLADMRGDAVLYLWNNVEEVKDAIGYHDANDRGIPFGYVFTEIAKDCGEDWSVTLSHEALEMIGDPEGNLLVMGPHPTERRNVFHWFEMCDAVQDESYLIDGVRVSNFVLPLYFTGTRSVDEVGARNDFLGRAYRGKTLRSFAINPGGYIGFYDPQKRRSDQFQLRGDKRATLRQTVKASARAARRSIRYRNAADKLTAGGAKAARALNAVSMLKS